MTDSYRLTLVVLWTVNLSRASCTKRSINTRYYSLFTATFLILERVRFVTSFYEDMMMMSIVDLYSA